MYKTKQLISLMLLALVLVGCDTAQEIANQAEPVPTVADSGAGGAVEAIVQEAAAAAQAASEATAQEIIAVEPTAAPPTDIPAQTSDYSAPAWTTTPLVDARTGNRFTLADFAGKTVFVEPMATWCSNCRAQQQQVVQAMSQLSADEFVFISLSVEVGLDDAALASYAERNGFTQIFSVASGELLAQLTEQFGRTITSPPSTPHFVISPTGSVTDLSTGRKSSADIVSEVTTVAQS